MNQLEFFVGSSDVARADILRYLRLLRELDGQITYHLGCLRACAAEADSPPVSPRPSPSPDRGASLSRTIGGRKRQRGSPSRRGAVPDAGQRGGAASTADRRAVHVVRGGPGAGGQVLLEPPAPAEGRHVREAVRRRHGAAGDAVRVTVVGAGARRVLRALAVAVRDAVGVRAAPRDCIGHPGDVVAAGPRHLRALAVGRAHRAQAEVRSGLHAALGVVEDGGHRVLPGADLTRLRHGPAVLPLAVQTVGGPPGSAPCCAASAP
ncbi:hypothetical protein STCU_10811 [Strigomonas culicis]|uniref:Uncharacterized protein n=1 Tax=Strigomonas culicis TaxID=28005 RepID=S9TJY3_9TRYP|nr:hypothetical protein STCU_10811 [Strigomonas culicis]|eukprot:EPY17114.1 hypothetical protein STCU_10811 [Strigomonas culicis]